MSGFCTYLPNKTVVKTVPKKVKNVAPAKKSNFITETAPREKKAAPVRDKKVEEKAEVARVVPTGDDYDIFRIDKHIKQMLSSRMSTLSDVKKDLETMLWIANYGADNLDKLQAKKQVQSLRRRVCDIECGFELGLYLLKSADILARYREVVMAQKSRSFVLENKALVNNTMKEGLAAEYLRIAREYIPIDEFIASTRKMSCPVCGGTSFNCEEDETSYICANVECATVVDLLSDAPTFKDTDRVNMAARYTYTCRTHFIDAMNRFEGIQNTEIKPEILDILRREMTNHSLTDKSVTKDHLYMFLAENQLSSHYEDLNLLYKLIAGVVPPSISEYRTELLDMFQQVEDTYPEIKDPERVNSMNVNFKLYKLLQLLDYPCRKDDFYILKTPAKLGEHDEKWNELIDALIKKYPNVMTTKGKKRWRHIRTV